ncbi:MAG: hypothetical protein ACYS21_10530 [Planctomycetota bacterium]|jgi:hypothetical protein
MATVKENCQPKKKFEKDRLCVQEIREYESFSQTNKYNRKEAEFRQRADRGKLTTGWV